MKRYIPIVMFLVMVFLPFSAQASAYFSDVPAGHWAAAHIDELRELGITSGMGDGTFGMGRQITRAEFVTMLVNLRQPIDDLTQRYVDVNPGDWFFARVNTAWLLRFTDDIDGDYFRPNDPITREEMAVMIVNSMGYAYQELAGRAFLAGDVFTDISGNKGHITIAKDLGIIAGISPTEFGPAQTATREQSAAMIMRMHNILERRITEVHGFYAIAAFNQVHMLADMDTVSFGWSLLETDGSGVWLNTGSAGGNEFRIPAGHDIPWSAANHANRLLMIAVRESDSPNIINNPALREGALNAIATAINNGLETPTGERLHFNGVTLNFEGLRGEETRNNYTAFVRQLRERIGDKLLYVTVQPPRHSGLAYFNGYDFRAIGEVADRVILMAHDYNAKVLTQEQMAWGINPIMGDLAPLDEVYFALRALTDSETGVADISKIMLQLNFATAQWKLQDGAVINSRPFTPSYDAIAERIRAGAVINNLGFVPSPHILFYDNNDNTNNIVQFEDEQSVRQKIRLAGSFGVQGISLWRLGIVPDFDDIEGLAVFDTIVKWRE